jgi:hypothetical protein
MKVKQPATWFQRAVLPLAVFIGVVILHFVWLYLFPEQDPVQKRWVTVEQGSSPLKRYIETQSYLLGYSYALAFSFTAVAFRSYREKGVCYTGSMAFGSLTFSGILAVAGCYLIGCCGSPMLGVYLSLFGAAFLPLAKPLIAALTTISIAVSWLWMNHRSKRSVGPELTGLLR